MYVGSTKQRIRTRLYGALNADGSGGYYGYAWKKSEELLQLDVWILHEAVSEPGKRCMIAETIEAEVVFLVRSKGGNWPKYQTEIHFHSSSDAQKEMAATIFEMVQKRAALTPP